MSGKSFYSDEWHRVSGLRLRLKSNAGIHRQEFRGQLWYVLQDRTSGRSHRFSPEAWLVISLLDGRRTVQEIWDTACARLGDDALSQNEIMRLLAQLHHADVLQGDVMPDVDEMLHRAGKQERKKRMMSFINPLAIRMPLLDPDAFLAATLPLVRPLIGRAGGLLFVGLMGYALVQLGLYWSELTEDVADRVLAADNLVLLIVTYPLVKALHELGHGYTIKRWGGEVHEIGIMMLVFMPVPYVDASDASRFPEKWRRIIVGAAGMIVELTLAALALIVWIHAEEGMARAVAFNVMLLAGVSTILFNGNPLLRFDGYYVLADLIEIPNLAQRANRYIGYLIQRYAFGIETVESPVTARGEPKWLFSYAIAAFAYRLFIVSIIFFFVVDIFPLIGAVLAVWSLIMMFGVPIAKQIWFLLTSPKLRHRRGRAFAVTSGMIGTIAAVLSLVPLPYATLAEGVVWTPHEATVHTAAAGHVEAVYVTSNDQVQAGTTLLKLSDPVLDRQVAALEARVRELAQRADAVAFDAPAEARVLRERLAKAEADLDNARERQEDLAVRSSVPGRFVLPSSDAGDLDGRYYDKGERFGYIADFSDPVLIVVVPEKRADLVRSDTQAVAFRFADDPRTAWPAQILREVPRITDELPTAALAQIGGGTLSLDPSQPEALRSLTRVLQLELVFEQPNHVVTLGGRVHVRFRHADRPLAQRAWRALRQLFLSELNV
ncbi:biotin/lipoyl-binding protein [Halomonas lysinitropha]|uniref:Peptidase family M50 n=1 Tax=Halomonas lysinitropha TaxID=2607506 RepID=A0A5K1IA06_9GAMM|nr:biotin/lipoyl-binding protein [Halomonas lysinitropha]VVZ96988.1 Peptidase family M50 [Halomonas lysinitropha]